MSTKGFNLLSFGASRGFLLLRLCFNRYTSKTISVKIPPNASPFQSRVKTRAKVEMIARTGVRG